MDFKTVHLRSGPLWDEHTIWCAKRTNASTGCLIRPKIGCIACFEIYTGGTELPKETKRCSKCNYDIPISHFHDNFEFCKSCTMKLSKMNSYSDENGEKIWSYSYLCTTLFP